MKGLVWFGPDGVEMTEPDWFDSGRRTIGMYLDGRGLRERGPRGEPVQDDSFLLVLHAGADDRDVVLPDGPYADAFRVLVDTTTADGRPAGEAVLEAGTRHRLTGRSFLLLRAIRADAPDHGEG